MGLLLYRSRRKASEAAEPCGSYIVVHPYDSSATDLFSRLHWKNLRNQRLFAKAVMMFKILNGQTPDYLSNKFIFRNDTTCYRLRNSDMRLALPQPRTDYVRKSFSYSGVALWNSLPTDIRVSKTLGEIEMKLSNFSFEPSELLTQRP